MQLVTVVLFYFTSMVVTIGQAENCTMWPSDDILEEFWSQVDGSIVTDGYLYEESTRMNNPLVNSKFWAVFLPRNVGMYIFSTLDN